MKKLLTIFLILTIANSVFAQKFLDNSESSIIKPDLTKGIPENLKVNFKNFNSQTKFNNVQSLQQESYVTTNAQLSTIIIEKKNIGRMVLYAKLFNVQDSILYNPSAKREGRITIKSFRDNNIIDEMTTVTIFDEDIFQQIHLNTLKAGINKIVIDFETKNDLFIVEKFKVSPYNLTGINYYDELEKSQNEILNLSDNLENEASKIKIQHQDQIKRIETSYTSINSLINGNKFQNLSLVQSNSLNPFTNNDFSKHYNEILDKASAGERLKLENLRNELKNDNFINVALTLDNLLLGGKFSSIINLIDNIFKTNINIKNTDSETVSIINLDEKYYYKKDKSDGYRLKQITEQPILNEIEVITLENKAYQTFVRDIANFRKDDMKSLIQLNADIATANTIRKDLEILTWQIIKPYTNKEKLSYVKDTGINFTVLATDLEKMFDPKDFQTISELKQIRNQSIISIKKLNELMIKYSDITSKVKTHYDIIYEIRPRERKVHFNKLTKLPGNLKSDWKDQQDKIIDEYKKNDGLKDFLSAITGKE